MSTRSNLAAAAKKFPQAKTYTDWRKCLDQKDIDAVVCATTDHTHAFVNIWAMNRGKHVYCEKPLANSVHEARLVRETYLKNKGKLATQMGTQIHATRKLPPHGRADPRGRDRHRPKVHVWCSRTPEGGSYLPEEPVPPGIDWDLWIGPSRFHPYNSGLHQGRLSDLEPLLGLRQRPDRRHGQPHDGHGLLGPRPAAADDL